MFTPTQLHQTRQELLRTYPIGTIVHDFQAMPYIPKTMGSAPLLDVMLLRQATAMRLRARWRRSVSCQTF